MAGVQPRHATLGMRKYSSADNLTARFNFQSSKVVVFICSVLDKEKGVDEHRAECKRAAPKLAGRSALASAPNGLPQHNVTTLRRKYEENSEWNHTDQNTAVLVLSMSV